MTLGILFQVAAAITAVGTLVLEIEELGRLAPNGKGTSKRYGSTLFTLFNGGWLFLEFRYMLSITLDPAHT